MGNCLICLLNGLTVGFKKALLTFGCIDQEERLCFMVRMRTKGELAVYLQSAEQKTSHKMISMETQTSTCQNGMEKKITHMGSFLSVLESICFQKQHGVELGCPIQCLLAPCCQGECEMWPVQIEMCRKGKRHTRFQRLSRKKESQIAS